MARATRRAADTFDRLRQKARRDFYLLECERGMHQFERGAADGWRICVWCKRVQRQIDGDWVDQMCKNGVEKPVRRPKREEVASGGLFGENQPEERERRAGWTRNELQKYWQ